MKATKLAFYILRGKKPVTADRLEWCCYIKTADRHVALDHIGKYKISTVFLGIDYGFGLTKKPLLFESMVFDENLESVEDFTRRYNTWDEAKKGHGRIVQAVRKTVAGR